jgi:hypothetical protein
MANFVQQVHDIGSLDRFHLPVLPNWQQIMANDPLIFVSCLLALWLA